MTNPTPQISATALQRAIPLWRWLMIIGHVISGVGILCFLFPFLNRQKKDQKIQQWCARLLAIFHLKLVVRGAERLTKTPYLMISNHISWIDIHVINSFKPIRFVAKSEVKSWPIFGWMATQLGTVFIRRDSTRQARLVVEQMAEVLKSESVCIFPEGTSTSGGSVLPFKHGLFEAALVAQTPVFPLAVQYFSTETGLRSEATAFIGEMGLLESMANILKSRHLQARLTVLEPFPYGSQEVPDRKHLANYCHEAISRIVDDPNM
ncbi:lyso-ornithine lipid acyltransferase [Polynucleobacter meluiroseus]|uniref:1-acyl-sn-glycerol-3-phosphate acyltransferase n=2 Tax=Polynucleobacter meluiroseus TaxID=1938814 RepID=A0A240E4V2_9BURK|nr:lyso-ornithine lipid acyltransferase [Polynucleobacter meluiroseus]